jgi:exopolysaccharide biosynthesis polyprenyl glycosylphosphotransferase
MNTVILSTRVQVRFRGFSLSSKRCLDLVGASLGLALLSPMLIAIAVLIRASSRGPVLYRQERVGRGGRRFLLVKFRTMIETAEEDGRARWTVRGDPRRTRVGACLRRFSLDELPNLWNVLRGEMSLVGPRPERPHFVEKFQRIVPSYSMRHQIDVGITGWAQVNGWRGNTSIRKRVECDLFYLRHRSLGFDLWILVRTVLFGVFAKNAY